MWQAGQGVEGELEGGSLGPSFWSSVRPPVTIWWTCQRVWGWAGRRGGGQGGWRGQRVERGDGAGGWQRELRGWRWATRTRALELLAHLLCHPGLGQARPRASGFHTGLAFYKKQIYQGRKIYQDLSKEEEAKFATLRNQETWRCPSRVTNHSTSVVGNVLAIV